MSGTCLITPHDMLGNIELNDLDTNDHVVTAVVLLY